MATRPPLSSFVGTTTPTTRPPLSSFVKPAIRESAPIQSPTESGLGSLPVLKQVTQFGAGLGSEIGKAGIGIGQTIVKGVGALADVLSPGASAPLKPVQEGLESIKQNVYVKPFEKETESISGKAGQFAGIAAPFIAGTPAVTKGQAFLSGLTKTDKVLGSTKVLPYLVEKFAQIAPEMTVTGATEYAVTGGDAKKAKTAAITAGVFSGITHVGSDLYRQIIPKDLKTNVIKSIGGLKGKTGLKDVVTNKKVNDAIDAYTTISRYSPDIKVVGEDGIEKVFDPTKATFVEMPQALYQTKKKIYEEYSRAAAESGVKFTAKDFYSVIDDLKKYNGKGFTPAYSAKAKQVIDSLQRFLTKNAKGGKFFPDTDLLEIQGLIENINVDVNPLSDKAGAKVAIEASNQLRQILDDKILNASGAQYQQLRTAYSQLKSIENDVINAFKKTTRGSALSDVIDGLASVDGLQGLLTQSPDMAARGFLIKAVKSGFKYIRDPEVAMRRAFSIINNGEKVAGRFAGVASEANPAFQAGQKTQQAVGEFIKNPKVGLGIENIAKNISMAEKGTLRDFTDLINGSYRPGPVIVKQLKQDVQSIVDKYNFDAALKGDKALANQIGQYLDSVGFDKKVISNTSSNVLNYIKGHISEAQDVLDAKSPNFESLGGMVGLLNRTKTNIVDGLTAEGKKSLAQKIANIDLSKITSLERFNKIIQQLIK